MSLISPGAFERTWQISKATWARASWQTELHQVIFKCQNTGLCTVCVLDTSLFLPAFHSNTGKENLSDPKMRELFLSHLFPTETLGIGVLFFPVFFIVLGFLLSSGDLGVAIHGRSAKSPLCAQWAVTLHVRVLCGGGDKKCCTRSMWIFQKCANHEFSPGLHQV